MQIVKDSEKYDISFIDDSQIKIKMFFVPSFFVIEFSSDINSKNPIIVTNEDDEYLYSNLCWLMNQSYSFPHKYSLKTSDEIIWLSEHCFDMENEFELDNTPRLVIKREEEKFKIYCKRPFFEKNSIKNGSSVSFAPAGNGFLSKNLDTNFNFQDDIIKVFTSTLNDKKISNKKRQLKS